MTVRPIENSLIYFGEEYKAAVSLNPRQKWEKVESRVPGTCIVRKNGIKLFFPSQDFKRYFREDDV